MKKAVIAVAALAAAAGISIGAFLAVRSKSENDTKKQNDTLAKNVLFDENADDINRLTITIGGEKYVALREEGIEWSLAECPGEKFDLNDMKLQAICTYISNLTASDSYGELTEENMKKYGLDDPYIITFEADSEEHTLYLGALSPTGEFCYAYTDAKKEVFVIPESTAGYLFADPVDLISDSLLPYSDNDIVGIEVKRGGKTAYALHMDQENGAWYLSDEYSMLNLNQARPSSIVTLITRLSAESVYAQSPDDFKSFGFDDPDAELIVSAADGSQRRILCRYYGKDAKENIHVYLENEKLVEVYYTADFSFLNYDLIDLVSTVVECGAMYAVSGFEFTTAELSESFTVDPENDKAECRGTVIDLKNAEVKSFYENFYNTFAFIRICGIDIEAEPELTEPMYTAKFDLLSGKTIQIDLVEYDETSAYLFVNGEYTGTLADSQFVSGDDSMISAYEMLCRHSGLESNLTN